MAASRGSHPRNPVNRTTVRTMFGDGKWRKVGAMAAVLTPLVPPEYAVRALMKSKAPPEVKSGEGRVLRGTGLMLIRLLRGMVEDGCVEKRGGGVDAKGRHYPAVYLISPPRILRSARPNSIGATASELYEAAVRLPQVTHEWAEAWFRPRANLAAIRKRIAARVGPGTHGPTRAAVMTEAELIAWAVSGMLRALISAGKVEERVTLVPVAGRRTMSGAVVGCEDDLPLSDGDSNGDGTCASETSPSSSKAGPSGTAGGSP